MRLGPGTTSTARRGFAWIVLVATASLLSCRGAGEATSPSPSPTTTPTPSPSSLDVARFVELARGADCADRRNRLFVIDETLVFWDLAGNCADASYTRTLYRRTPENQICTFHDSIAGPIRGCDGNSYQRLFDTILAHLEDPDLGLGPSHQVRSIPL